MVVVSNTGYLILIGSKVHTNIVTEVLTDLVVPSESKFYTSVLYVTTIDGCRIGTIDGKQVTTDQPVLCRLFIPVEVNTQTAVEETGIET